MTATRHTPPPRPAASRLTGTRRLVVAVLAVAMLLTGCDLRLETPAPQAPQPDAAELARSRTVDDSAMLAEHARLAALGPAADDDAIAQVLGSVAAFSDLHGEQLGGVYVSGLDADGTLPETASSAPPIVLPGEVLALLGVTALTARSDADSAASGALARLLASVSAARADLAVRLAAALGVDAPTGVAPTFDPAPTPGAVDLPVLSALVLAEDEAGYAFEVIAAKLADAQRADAQGRAAQHRARAQVWADASGLVSSGSDPRRTAYALPAGLDDPAVAVELARAIEASLAAGYANLVAEAAAGTRASAVDALRQATADAAAWGAEPAAFPGLPEQAAPVALG
ncbi:DUF4439 domain-containing protein [Cellulomonas timonensis]|uniref:DUF4439 domain-containing protein n=1 Tax=Cellulomonas timonensis TaxID=1689271 RepID=UPI00082F1708|nr:DUF4439 domain-containing protein [Cellulomonas timonensis]